MKYLRRIWCRFAHRGFHPTDIHGWVNDCGTDAGWSDYRSMKQ